MIESAKTIDDCREAFKISINAFYPDGPQEKIVKDWETKWFQDPSFKPENIYIIKEDNRIIAGIRVIERTIQRQNINYSMLGIGEIFVCPGSQGKGLTKLLVQAVINRAVTEGFDFLVSIARKAIDYFYLRYGLWGFGSYSEITLKGFKDCDISDLNHITLDLGNIDATNQFYENSYKESFGWMKRNRKHWEYLIKIRSSSTRSIQIIKRGQYLIGYIIKEGNLIIELATGKEKDYFDVLNYTKPTFYSDLDSITIKVPPQHTLLKVDLKLDITKSLRECYYGGHILRITNIESVLDKFSSREVAWYTENGISRYEYQKENIKIKWDNHQLTTQGLDALSCQDYPSYQSSILLTGAQVQYAPYDQPKLAAPYLPFFIPPIDEF